MTISKRLEALEQATTAKRGIVVFYSSDSQPGQFWQAAGNDYRPTLHGIDGGAPTNTKRFTQADVDKAGKTHYVIVVEYVAKWRADEP